MMVLNHGLCVRFDACYTYCVYIYFDRRLLAIEKDRQPQVIRIVHSDGDDDDINKDSSNEYDEGAHSLSLISDREDEEESQEGQKTGHRDPQSPDSLLQSPSPGSSFFFFLYSPGLTYNYGTNIYDVYTAVFAELSMLLSLSDHIPCPPPKVSVPSTGKRVAEIRARRHKISSMGVGMQKLTTETITSDVTTLRDMSNKVLCPEALQMQRSSSQILYKPHRPDSSPMITMEREWWYVLLGFF